MKSVYLTKEDCCGCSACYNVCAKQAITMKADEEGFLYPEIDQIRCIDCGRCIQICPLIHDGNYKNDHTPRFYVARHKSQEVLRQSTSGGAFTAISDDILRQNGVVYGVDYDAGFHVLHQRAETAEQRDRMRISKYVQSDIGDIYAQIKDDLRNGRMVLFTGTPCQAAGLRGFMNNSPLMDRLYICDLICHSIPSPLIWEEYKLLLEREKGGKLVSVQFRSKKDGWSRGNSNKGFLFSTDKSPAIHEDDRFYQLFFKVGTITRPSCSQCRFTDIHRVSDLTIADYFGIEKYSPEWFDPLGVSLILVNSQKGASLFDQCRQDLHAEERPKEEALNEQKRLSKSSQSPGKRSIFWEEFRRFGFEYVIGKLE
ncbi:MAG: Coenzyme F420 hydrogenase/dehydrogenase, beta subunit C-terminal domain [Negativicutes bacterium]